MRALARVVAAGVAFVVGLAPGPGAAQRPAGPPVFEPGDAEGLVVSPNPQIRHAWKRRVFWKKSLSMPRAMPRGMPVPSAAERAAMTATLDALVRVFEATPTGRDGEGFWVHDARVIDHTDPDLLSDKTPLARFPLVHETGLFPFHHEDVQDKGRWRLSVTGETESTYFAFNRLPESAGQPVLLSEPRGAGRPPEPWYLRPRITATWQGLPVYEEQVLVVAREGRDPWAPVPMGRALKVALTEMATDRRTAEDRLAGYRRQRDTVMSPEWERTKREQFERQNGALRESRPSNHAARLRSLEHEIQHLRQKAQAEAEPQDDAQGAWYWTPVKAHDEAAEELAGLDADQAGEPACVEALPDAQTQGRYRFKVRLVACSEAPEARPLVRTDWSYFDLALPRTAPQILVLRDFGRCARVVGGELVSAPVGRWDVPPQGCVRHAQMWREADWSAVAATVRR